MIENPMLIDAGTGIVLASVVFVWIKRLARSVTTGEIYALMTPDGDGLVGFVDRTEKPMLFWTVLGLRVVILTLVVIFYFVWLVRWSW